MTIDRHNYEAFMLDYLEGRLDSYQIAALELFLENNPALKEKLIEPELVTLSPDQGIRFKEKEQLKKTEILPFSIINEDNYFEFFVDASEGVLSLEKQLAIEEFLALNPTLRNDFGLIAKCHLTPDRSIVNPAKDELKRKVLPLSVLRESSFVLAAAASVLLLIGFFWLLNPVQFNKAPIAQATEKTIEQPENNLLAEVQKNPAIRPGNINKTKHFIGKQLPNELKIETIPVKDIHAPLRLALMPSNAIVSDLVNHPTINFSARLDVSQFYDDILLAQCIRYDEPTIEEMAKEGFLLASSTLVQGFFRPENVSSNLEARQINWWRIADIGINGFSRLTSSSLAFRKETDEDGNVKAFALQSNSFNINRGVHKRKD